MSDPNATRCVNCGHPRGRHFAGSMVIGNHACLVVVGKKPCECRCFEDETTRGSQQKKEKR